MRTRDTFEVCKNLRVHLHSRSGHRVQIERELEQSHRAPQNTRDGSTRFVEDLSPKQGRSVGIQAESIIELQIARLHVHEKDILLLVGHQSHLSFAGHHGGGKGVEECAASREEEVGQGQQCT